MATAQETANNNKGPFDPKSPEELKKIEDDKKADDKKIEDDKKADDKKIKDDKKADDKKIKDDKKAKDSKALPKGEYEIISSIVIKGETYKKGDKVQLSKDDANNFKSYISNISK